MLAIATGLRFGVTTVRKVARPAATATANVSPLRNASVSVPAIRPASSLSRCSAVIWPGGTIVT
jgi:hypothetical protein